MLGKVPLTAYVGQPGGLCAPEPPRGSDHATLKWTLEAVSCTLWLGTEAPLLAVSSFPCVSTAPSYTLRYRVVDEAQAPTGTVSAGQGPVSSSHRQASLIR